MGGVHMKDATEDVVATETATCPECGGELIKNERVSAMSRFYDRLRCSSCGKSFTRDRKTGEISIFSGGC